MHLLGGCNKSGTIDYEKSQWNQSKGIRCGLQCTTSGRQCCNDLFGKWIPMWQWLFEPNWLAILFLYRAEFHRNPFSTKWSDLFEASTSFRRDYVFLSPEQVIRFDRRWYSYYKKRLAFANDLPYLSPRNDSDADFYRYVYSSRWASSQEFRSHNLRRLNVVATNLQVV